MSCNLQCNNSSYQIPKVERLNNLAINVLGFQHKRKHDGTVDTKKGYFFPLHISKRKTAADTVNLLLLDNEEGGGGDKKHYVLITRLSGLLYSTTNSHKVKHFCMWCLRG